jgi:hypothetical protein
MEIPLGLSTRSGRLVYAIAWPFRAGMAAILALLAWAAFMDGGRPGVSGWIILGLVALGGLYEERWVFDPAAGRIVHRSGLLFLAKRKVIALDEVLRFRFAPFVRGTVPGSADEAAQNDLAMRGSPIDDSGKKRSSYKKPFICLVVETQDGERHFVDALSSKKKDALHEKAVRIAEACGKPLVEGAAGTEE